MGPSLTLFDFFQAAAAAPEKLSLEKKSGVVSFVPTDAK
jgi:hypothetical protein